MSQPVCAHCVRLMTCERNGVAIIYGDGPYAMVHSGDLYRCTDCPSEVVTGISLSGTRLDLLSSVEAKAALRLNQDGGEA